MTRIYICDDEKRWQDKAVSILNDFAARQGAEAKISCFDNTDAVLRSNEAAPDVLFTDIEFGDKVSIDAVSEINRMYPECHVVYLTNHIDYATDVYNTRHVWYVLKNQFAERLPEIYRKVCRLDDEKRSYLVVKTTSGITTRIPVRDIMYLERRDRKTIIVTYEKKYEVKERIPYVLEKLPDHRFARCHNSFAVNLDKVREIHTGNLVMRNGTEIMISRGYSKSFRTEYMNWVEERTVR